MIHTSTATDKSSGHSKLRQAPCQAISPTNGQNVNKYFIMYLYANTIPNSLGTVTDFYTLVPLSLGLLDPACHLLRGADKDPNNLIGFLVNNA